MDEDVIELKSADERTEQAANGPAQWQQQAIDNLAKFRAVEQELLPNLDEEEVAASGRDLFENDPMRAAYVIGQCMYYGVLAMDKVPDDMRELSNIADAIALLRGKVPMFLKVLEAMVDSAAAAEEG